MKRTKSLNSKVEILRSTSIFLQKKKLSGYLKKIFPQLFDRDRSVIGKHINNIFKGGELSKDISCANIVHKIGDQTWQN